MSETTNNEVVFEPEKPVLDISPKFPPFPEPTDADFEDDLSEEEKEFYKNKFSDLHLVKYMKLHCTACDRHLGCSPRNESRMRTHPMLRTLVCHTCYTFYNSGEFDKGDDGSELYCRWCGQGGQVYCCSNCPHVFCAKCIKRNFGLPKIKEIENTDDWKCFKCNPKCLWDLRGLCWGLLRYCDFKNKIMQLTEDPVLKAAYQKDCALDLSECCKTKTSRRSKNSELKKKELETSTKKSTFAVVSKLPPTIQVKKFASISADNTIKPEKKVNKRPSSPKVSKSVMIKSPLPLPSNPKTLTPVVYPPLKKIRMSTPQSMCPIKIQNDMRQPAVSFPRIRPKPSPVSMTILNSHMNGYNHPGIFTNMIVNDNINLSLESLTQGLDMAAVATMSSTPQDDDDVVCTPDFPLEPVCEVTEDNTDDDVQCMTPGPVAFPKITTPPPLTRITKNVSNDLNSDNIIQMTENDVTVNELTGGLKFRVDPQTLSSNKMYRLPDGRIFAINANPNMPGGYSATIVAVTENNSVKSAPRGSTFAAKLSAVTAPPKPTPPQKAARMNHGSKSSTPKITKVTRATETVQRQCDLKVPIEWFRYNLIDAVDALEYSLSRLQKLKKEATTMFLRTRSIDEMRTLHRSFDTLLNTSSGRFKEIRDSLNKEMKQYLTKKMKCNDNVSEDDDDDDVEILNDLGNDDPIFIDENSTESNVHELNDTGTEEVDLTDIPNSDQNESGEKSTHAYEKDPFADVDDGIIKKPTISTSDENSSSKNEDNDNYLQDEADTVQLTDKKCLTKANDRESSETFESKIVDTNKARNEGDTVKSDTEKTNTESQDPLANETKLDKVNGDIVKENMEIKNNGNTEEKEALDHSKEVVEDVFLDSKQSNENKTVGSVNLEDADIKSEDVSGTQEQTIEMKEEKDQDTEMSDEMIETLLKGDDGETLSCLDVPESQES